MHPSWEAKQRDAAIVGSFTPVSFFVYGNDQFANLSAPFQKAMPLDTHESAKPTSVPSAPNSRRGFTIRLKRLKPRAPDFWGPQNFGSKENFQYFRSNHICIFVLVQRTFPYYVACKRSLQKNECEGLK